MFELFLADNAVFGVAAVLIVLSFALMAVGISVYIGERRLAERRLELPSSISSVISEGADRLVAEDDVLGSIAKYVTPSDPKELSGIRQRLVRAGYRNPSAVRVYFLAKAGCAIGFALGAALLFPMFAPTLSALLTGLLVVVVMFVGYFFPVYWVERKAEYRKLEVRQGFPDVLDLLLVCVEAGNSVDQALARVTKEIGSTNIVLAEELAVTSTELRAGKTRSAAFRDFAARVNVDDVSAFATVLRQADEFGTSIADTLRVYASEMRHKRVMRAEEIANIMPLKLAMGTMAFTVPPIMFIMGGPAVLAILTAFAGMG